MFPFQPIRVLQENFPIKETWEKEQFLMRNHLKRENKRERTNPTHTLERKKV